jgi:phosphoglycolate phosphatase-like HAD superfamily hydrolase
MFSHPRLIVFDLDGTLVDTMGAFADIAGGLISEHYGWSFEQGRRCYLETSGVPFFQQLEILFPNEPRNNAVSERFEKRKIASFMRETISEKALETLHTLKDREIFTAISSNNFDPLVKEFVHRENVPVDLALGFKENFSKGTSHFGYLRDYFGIAKTEMIFVGDSLKDAQLAAQNRVKFIAKIGTFSESDFLAEKHASLLGTIYEIHEILEIMESL